MTQINKSFSEEVNNFIQNNPWLCGGTLGFAIVAYSVVNFFGRVVSAIAEAVGTTKKTDTIAQHKFSTISDERASKENPKGVPNMHLPKNQKNFPLPQPLQSQSIPSEKHQPDKKEMLQTVLSTATKYPYKGFGIQVKAEAASIEAFNPIRKNMTLTKNVRIDGIGNVSNCYVWNERPVLNANVPTDIERPAVHLPDGMTEEEFAGMRRLAQQSVTSGKGISPPDAETLALRLGGVVIEATLPYRAGNLLDDKKGDVKMHCIFQTGINFAGIGGGGVPINNEVEASKKIVEYSVLNAYAALSSAIDNKSDVLVFNIGIGSGFFGGNYGGQVKQANIDGICSAITNAKRNEGQIEVVVPNAGFSKPQLDQLDRAGIKVALADKDAVAALCARAGLRVSETIAGDPMSILGIHGPGFWWETVGTASDEERAAFLSPCYVLGHIPIDIYEFDKQGPQKIAALSEFMIKP